MVAPFVAEALADLGYEVVGPAPNLAVARELIEAEEIDAALMDVFIRGERVFGLCELLVRKNVPFVLTSGYADWQIPEEWLDRPRLHKPYEIDQLGEAIGGLFGATPG